MHKITSTVSLLVAAKYNADQYKALIDSAIGYVDEIITVLDDGAENGIDGYREDEVNYLFRPMDAFGAGPDFAAQNNFLTLQARSKWLLLLDTDENLDPWLWERIKLIADSTIEETVSFPVHTTIIGRQDFVGWPDYHVRLYRRNDRIRWHRANHPMLVEVLTTRTLPMELRYAIHHIKTIAMQERSDELSKKYPPQ